MIFHPEAPITVKVGAIGVLLLSIADSLYRYQSAAIHQDASAWGTVLRPLLGLSVGISFAWGIARMNGLFYWFWLFPSTLLFGVLIVDGFYRMFRPEPNSGYLSVDVLLWLITALLLWAPASLRAFSRQGSLGARRDVG